MIRDLVTGVKGGVVNPITGLIESVSTMGIQDMQVKGGMVSDLKAPESLQPGFVPAEPLHPIQQPMMPPPTEMVGGPILTRPLSMPTADELMGSGGPPLSRTVSLPPEFASGGESSFVHPDDIQRLPPGLYHQPFQGPLGSLGRGSEGDELIRGWSDYAQDRSRGPVTHDPRFYGPPTRGGLTMGPGPMGPIGMGPMFGGPMYAGPMFGGPQFAYPSMAPASTTTVSSSSAAMTTESSASASTTSTSQSTTEAEGGGGLDAEMIERLSNSSNPKWRNSKFVKFLKQVQTGEIRFENNEIVYNNTLSASSSSLSSSSTSTTSTTTLPDPSTTDKLVQYSSPSTQLELAEDEQWKRLEEEMRRAREAAGFGYGMEDIYGGGGMMEAYDTMGSHMYGSEMEEWLKPQEKKDPEYKFETKNPYLSSSSSASSSSTSTSTTSPAFDAFAEGVKLLKLGRLRKAILCLECAVQQDPSNADAWRYLGQARAENEDEANAIAALLKAIEIDPHNLPALMMLGVSYTNDLEEARALKYLKTWILHHPDYQSSSMELQKKKLAEYESFYGSQGMGGRMLDRDLHNEVVKLFINAVEINKDDPELHSVLGVLYHLTNDFDKAVQEFKECVRLKPDDATFWNKLGATLANNSRSSEAIPAYRKALELRPNYVRALANLAISFANENKHEDAARTYLATLKQNPTADHVWGYLRVSLSHLNRPELLEIVAKKDVELFKSHFKF